jgi:hypothetical protein
MFRGRQRWALIRGQAASCTPYAHTMLSYELMRSTTEDEEHVIKLYYHWGKRLGLGRDGTTSFPTPIPCDLHFVDRWTTSGTMVAVADAINNAVWAVTIEVLRLIVCRNDGRSVSILVVIMLSRGQVKIYLLNRWVCSVYRSHTGNCWKALCIMYLLQRHTNVCVNTFRSHYHYTNNTLR